MGFDKLQANSLSMRETCCVGLASTFRLWIAEIAYAYDLETRNWGP